MKIVYTKHAEEKLRRAEVKKLGITKSKIEDAVRNPEAVYPTIGSLVAIKKLDEKLSLCVAYKTIEEGIKIITFFPAKRGRYESKVL